MIFLIIISLHGGIDRVQMADRGACETMAATINKPLSFSVGQHAVAYCVPAAQRD